MDGWTDAEGETLLLALLNSAPIIDGVKRDELSGDSAPAWLRAHGGNGSPGELDRTLEARARLRQVALGEAEPATLAPILAGTRAVPTIEEGGVGWSTEFPADRSVAVRAVLAWDRLRRTAPGRLRACDNHECALFLIDHSKPNRARWCSMAVCGNRMKARRHYERTRAERT